MLSESSFARRISRFFIAFDESSQRCQMIHRLRVFLYQTNQCDCLRIGSGAALLPVFQRSGIGSEMVCEQCPGHVEALAQLQQFVGDQWGQGLDLIGAANRKAGTLWPLCDLSA